jgi:hypothetical protein
MNKDGIRLLEINNIVFHAAENHGYPPKYYSQAYGLYNMNLYTKHEITNMYKGAYVLR